MSQVTLMSDGIDDFDIEVRLSVLGFGDVDIQVRSHTRATPYTALNKGALCVCAGEGRVSVRLRQCYL